MIQDGSSCTAMASSESSSSKQKTTKELKEIEKSKTEALQAFRTIITMLSLIQSTKHKVDRNRPKSRSESEESTQLLQLLDAFAAVLVRKDGVIAVTARPYVDGSGKVEVLASYSGKRESLTISQPRSPVHFLRNVFISQNPRDPTVKRQPTVVDPETLVPDYLKKIPKLKPSILLNTFLNRIWWGSSNYLVKSFLLELCITGPHYPAKRI